MSLQTYRTTLGYKLRDTAGLITVPMQTAAVLEAVKRYSRVRPRERVQTITGDGTKVTFALASDFEERFSRIRWIENPVDQPDPEIVDENEYLLYRDPTTEVFKLRFQAIVLANLDKAYVNYTARHSVDDTVSAPAAPAVALAGLGAGNVTSGAHTYSQTYVTAAGETNESPASGSVTTTGGNGQANVGVQASASGAVTNIRLYRTAANGAQRKLLATLANTTAIYLDNLADGTLGANAPTTNTTGASVDTIPAPDQEAVAILAAALCARQIGAYYAQTTDSTMGADAVTYRTKSGEWLAVAKALEQDYCYHLGISGPDMVAAASVVGDLDVDLPWQTDRFYHPRRDR